MGGFSSCDVSIPIDDIVDLVKQQIEDNFVVDMRRSGGKIVIEMKDGKTHSVDDADLYLTDLTFDTSNNTLTATLNDGSTVSEVIPVGSSSSGTDNYLTDLTFDTSNNTLTATLNDGSTVSEVIPVGSSSSGTDTFVVSAAIRNNDPSDPTSLDYDLVLTRNDAAEVSVSLQGLLQNLVTIIYNLANGEDINEQTTDYTLQESDFTGKMIVYMGRETTNAGNITFTAPVLPDTYIKKRVRIRRNFDDPAALGLVVPATGVTFVPADAGVLRRIGSECELFYRGNGVYDVSEELA